MLHLYNPDDTIVALSTPHGSGAIAVIRISGRSTIDTVNNYFQGTDLTKEKGYSIHFGKLVDENNNVIDEVLISLFRSPKSYTGEDLIEISCHGSTYIINEILRLFLRSNIRMAEAGEFTMRAFINGKMDLSQAEAVADLIASKTKISHDIALKQLKGGFSSEIKILREKLVDFASLIELELDFSEEDVEFADREDLKNLIDELTVIIKKLIESYKFGNVLKKGVPTVIIGRPNAGKSTLLNALLNENRAIVSEIEGTTRDTIEEELNINGIIFRFIDTAGIREAKDTIESLGIEKTHEKIKQSSLIIYIYDISKMTLEEVKKDIDIIAENDTPVLIVANKTDIKGSTENIPEFHIPVSAKNNENIEKLKKDIFDSVIKNKIDTSATIITNERHHDLLIKALNSLQNVKEGLASGIPGDLIAMDIRQANVFLGEITGTISTDDLLGNIFGKFCIGK
ncbi:MAG TPA: tRNA uridine-5-carboxymethylaminomethyl(34) synthesis GTPase MnmE [Bacteroidetes bacterium]|nr:tRNA uridine-5-carboxymethylaminomethyl(34) synthesis GTPase MnmE [Bacteroidota bacterium]